ncbi:MAG: transcriptional regulator with XRE-family HTH domain [Kiritimatiellia bacterium]|jgi:transcriptional regulator with XRE-family HTH domain
MLRVDEKLKGLGSRLRAERLRRNDTQVIFAARLGISVPTLRKMESGDPSVLVGYWVAALNVLDRAGDLDAILAAPEDLFAKYDQVKTPLPRRASRRSR